MSCQKLNRFLDLCLILTYFFHSLSTLSAQVSSPQDYILFEKISVNDGLSQSTGRVIFQDSKGFMWFGTQDGLNKYDGYTFKHYNNNPLDTNSLSDNFILSICEDHEGILWIGTNGGGLNRFDPGKEEFIHFRYIPNNPSSILGDFINHIFEDSKDILWIGTNSGLNRFNRENQSFTRYVYDSENPLLNQVNYIFEDSRGNFWIGTNANGLIKFNRDTEQIEKHYTFNQDVNSVGGNNISCIVEDSYGLLWIGLNVSGLNKFDPSSEIFTLYSHNPNDSGSLSGNLVVCILESHVNEPVIWIGTQYGGLNRFNRESGTFTHYLNDPDDPFSISNNIIFSLEESECGTMWIGTGGGGINKFSLRKQKFYHYQNPEGVVSNFVWEILEDRNSRIWIGSQGGGLYCFQRDSHQFIPFPFDRNNPEASLNYVVLSVTESDDGTFWIGTGLNGLFRINPEKNISRQYMPVSNDTTSISSQNIRDIYKSQDGTIWIGTGGGGLNRYNNDDSFTRFINRPDDPQSISGNLVFCLFEDHLNYLWVGTYGSGLNVLDKRTGKFKRYYNIPNDSNSISSNRIRCIFEDTNNIIWVGTDHGLNKFNRETEKFSVYTTEEGLPNNVVYSVVPDDHRNFWLSTNYGISRFNPHQETFRNYDVEDGLQSNEFNTGAYYKTSSGELMFGGINGFNIFHPDSIADNSYIPPVMITNIKLFNRPVPVGEKSLLKKNITETEKVILPHHQNFISFEYSAFNYVNTEKNSYKYKMEGVDKEWVEAGTRRFADYPALRPGTYVFHVMGSNNDGMWNFEGDNIKIVIRPPWWQSKTAYIIYCLLIIGGIFRYIRWRINKLKRDKNILEQQILERTKEIARQKEEIEEQKNALEELNAAKNKLFTIIGHDLKNPMTALMSIVQALLMEYHGLNEEEKHDSLKQVDKAATDLYRLIDNLLQWTNLQTGKTLFEPRRFDLSSLINENINLHRPIAGKKNINLRSSIPDGLTVFADRNMISTVLRNLISNAIKFTHPNGEVKISSNEINLEADGKKIEVIVTDNGVGIPSDKLNQLFRIDNTYSTKGTANERGTGLGLLLCHDFIVRNGGRIGVESEKEKGSRFFITLPAE